MSIAMIEHGDSLRFLRCDVTDADAAMWACQTRIVAQTMGIDVTWEEISSDATENRIESDESFPCLIVVGIERSKFISMAAKLVKMREAQSRRLSVETFFVAWYPDSDIESRRLCHELGCDAVLHEASQVAGVIRRVIAARCDAIDMPFLRP